MPKKPETTEHDEPDLAAALLDYDALAFSYLRFSTPEQAKGDSRRRQLALADDWLKRHPRIRLDTSITLHDLGKSAFTGAHRKNPDRHALAAFLKMVHDGKIPKGSYLIIENLDRLSREDERPALRLWMDILDAGINIVQLQPETMFRHEKSDMLDIIRAIIELSRGHGESARKSERNGETWQQKLKQARTMKVQPPRRKDGRVTKAITSQLPAWLQEVDGEIVEIPERAAVVKRIFRMAAHEGLASIVKTFTDEGVPTFGDREPMVDAGGKPVLHESGPKKGRPRYQSKSGRYGSDVWVRAYLAKILKDRRALGEHQPKGKGRKPDGPPIAGYFPAVVTEQEWYAARAGAAERKRKPGRVSEYLNVFAGMLHNARDGDTFFMTRKALSKGGERYLVNTAGAEGRVRSQTFLADVFESAVFQRLSEIDPHEILNGDHAPDETRPLADELAGVEASIALIEAELDEHGDSPTLYKRLREKEREKLDLGKRLATARQEAAHPLSEAWGECQSLIRLADRAPNPKEARLRLRSAVRRIIDSVWILIVVRGLDRIALVQVWFADGKRCRSYLIMRRQARGNASARREWGDQRAAVLDDVIDSHVPDLRHREQAKKMEAAFLRRDVEELWLALMPPTPDANTTDE